MGAFGYFPTYALGNLYAAQLDEALRCDLPEADDHIRQGHFTPLRDWMHEHIHRHGKRWLPEELITKATGSAPSEEAFLRYLEAKHRSGGP
jgi:carboxypeptidase Taq